MLTHANFIVKAIEPSAHRIGRGNPGKAKDCGSPAGQKNCIIAGVGRGNESQNDRYQ